MNSDLPSISLLIDAGFSAPMGYPTGAKLNELLKNCDGHGMCVYNRNLIIRLLRIRFKPWIVINYFI
jgi:hypothetical protein